jgi:lysophospholipase L1-like esterase
VTATLTDGRTVTRIRGFRVADHISYVALGDSYAAGEGIAPYLQGPQDNLCHRSTGSWPGMVSVPDSRNPLSVRDDAEFQFLACSGARIVNLDTTPQPKQMWSGGRREIPLQLDLLRRDADLVTLSIGGNDLGFAPIVTHCFTSLVCQDDAFTTTASGTHVSLDDWTAIRLALIGNELTGTYQAVRSRVSTDTAVVVTTYPRLVSDWDRAHAACSPLLLSGDERRWLRRQVDTFAEIVHDRARRAGADVHVADVRNDFEGHNFCDSDSVIIGPTLWRLTEVGFSPLSAASFHPNSRGVQLYAIGVNETLRYDVDVPGTSRAHPVAATQATSTPQPAAVAQASLASTRPVVTTSRTIAVARTAPDPVMDPDGLLGSYPDDVVSAVGSTTFAEVALANGAALDGFPACDHVVPREVVPLLAQGFAPGSTLTATTRAVGHDGTESDAVTSEHVVGEDGRLISEIVAPPITGEGMLTVSLSGVGPGGGPAVGTALATTSDDPECVGLVQAAGRVAPEDATREPVGPSPASPEAVVSAVASPEEPPSRGGLALTGVPLVVAILIGATVLGGLGLVVVRRSRRPIMSR